MTKEKWITTVMGNQVRWSAVNIISVFPVNLYLDEKNKDFIRSNFQLNGSNESFSFLRPQQMYTSRGENMKTTSSMVRTMNKIAINYIEQSTDRIIDMDIVSDHATNKLYEQMSEMGTDD
jgi:hypothetical protein